MDFDDFDDFDCVMDLFFCSYISDMSICEMPDVPPYRIAEIQCHFGNF